MVTKVRRYTVEEFDEFVLLPENRDRQFEYIAGEIVEVVSNPKSSKIAARIIMLFGPYMLENDTGHLTGADGGYIVSGERYIPDVGFISYAKQPELMAEDGYNPNPPELAIEVLSPSNTPGEMRVKIANYINAETILWVVDPEHEQVEVYVPGQKVEVIGIDGILDGGNVLPGFKLAVKDIFPQQK